MFMNFVLFVGSRNSQEIATMKQLKKTLRPSDDMSKCTFVLVYFF